MPGNGEPAVRFEIRNVEGNLVATHLRVKTPDGNRTWWKLPNGEKGLGGIAPSSLPLFGSELMHSVAADSAVVVCEGEEATLAARRMGFPAFGTVSGAGPAPSDASLAPLLRFVPILFPRNDSAGRAHMHEVAEAITRMRGDVLLVAWTEGPPGGDAADFERLCGAAAFDALVDRAEPLATAGVGWNDSSILSVSDVRLADVEVEPLEWLWPGFIPFRKLTILDGDPGLGKSTVTLDLAARLSRGLPMPFQAGPGAPPPRHVLLLSAEDGLADTIKPRLIAAGADMDRIIAIRAGFDSEHTSPPISFPLHLPLLLDRIRRYDAGLVIIDPVMAFIGAATNTYNDQQVKRALLPVAAVAQETGAAILVVRHLTKNTSASALYRGGGSIGFVATARSGILIAKDPGDPSGERRVLASTKGNLARRARSVVFRIQGAEGGIGRVVWDGTTDHDADSLVARHGDEALAHDAVGDAKAFLDDLLSRGSISSKSVQTHAKDAGISPITLRRAKKLLGVVARRDGFGPAGAWSWALPDVDAQGPPIPLIPAHMSIYGDDEHLCADPAAIVAIAGDLQQPVSSDRISAGESGEAGYTSAQNAPLDDIPSEGEIAETGLLCSIDLHRPTYLLRTSGQRVCGTCGRLVANSGASALI